ncbi:hypothetical protein NM688_g6693 [Phlebia brevispora]|uniref:Uncharacterized protein n=1 Tax=Phlebia brevispora TaxID=194682 RepID=A0ACC1SDT6_9APHY|nr:hypothetical protein NM688_g6693 [Phlebia brevispora]
MVFMVFKKLIPAALLALAVRVVEAGVVKRNTAATCANGETVVNAECCALFRVREDLQNNLFRNECGDEAHEAIRLTFHDAIAFSPALEAEGKFGGGGADGSIAIFPQVETNFQANVGLDEVVEGQRVFLERSGMGVADFIQFAGAVALTNCPGAPVMNASIGRVDATRPAPDGLVPEPFGKRYLMTLSVLSLTVVQTTLTELYQYCCAHNPVIKRGTVRTVLSAR